MTRANRPTVHTYKIIPTAYSPDGKIVEQMSSVWTQSGHNVAPPFI